MFSFLCGRLSECVNKVDVMEEERENREGEREREIQKLCLRTNFADREEEETEVFTNLEKKNKKN